MFRVFTSAMLSLLFSGIAYAEEAPSEPPLTYTQVIEKALKRSPFVQEARHQTEFRRAQWMEARHARFVPKFEARYTLAPVPDTITPELQIPTGLEAASGPLRALATDSVPWSDWEFGPFNLFEVTALQPLFTFGKLEGLSRAAEGGIRAAMDDVENREREVVWRVSQIHFGFVLATQLTAIVEETETELTKVRNRVDKLVEKGDISQEDVQRLKLFEVELKTKKAEAELGVRQAKEGLRIAMGEALDVQTEFPDVQPEVPPFETVVAGAVERRPDLRQARHGLEARDAQVNVARSDFYPQFFVSGKFSWGSAPGRLDVDNPYLYDPLNGRQWAGAAGLNQNLNFLLTRDRVNQARQERAKLQAGIHGLQDLVEGDVTRAYFQYEEAKLKKENGAQAVRISRGWLSTAVNNHTLGLIGVRDVLDAFTAYLESKKDYSQSLHLYYTSLARLDYAAGTNTLGRDVKP